MRQPIKPHPRARRRRLFVGLLLAALAVVLAPTILAAMGLHNRVLATIVPPEAGTLTATSASWGWLSPTELRGVELHTPDGQLLLEVPTLTLDRTILDLWTDRANLGTVQVREPALHVEADEDSSTVEDFIARYVEARRDPPTLVTCVVEVQGGTVEIKEQPTGEAKSVSFDELTCTTSRGKFVALNTSLSTGPAGDGESAERGTMDVSLTTRADAARQLDFAAEDWPLGVASAWLARLVEGFRATGTLTGEASTIWGGGSGEGTFQSGGMITLNRFELQVPALAGEAISMAEIRMPWKIRADERQIHVDELSIASEVGEVTARGDVPRPNGAVAPRGEWLADAVRAPLAAEGRINLVRVAAMLPATLNLREGIRVTSGEAEFAVQSLPDEGAHRWTGSLAVRELAAEGEQHALQWERPVIVEAALRRDEAWTIESLTCQSDFLQVTAQGSAEQLDAQLDFDLARLAAELGQFVELDAWQLGGKGSLRAGWRPGEDGQSRATVQGNVTALRFVDLAGRLFNEPLLQLAADVTFSLPDEGRPLTIAQGSHLTLSTDKDRASVRLAAPATWPPASPGAAPWRGSVGAEGDLARWAERISPWIVFSSWRVGGTAKLSTSVEIDSESLRAETLQVELANLQAVGPGYRMFEELVTLTTAAQFQFAERRLDVGQTELIASSVALAARNTSIAWDEEGGMADFRGETTFRAALERLDAWRISKDGRPLPIRPAGMVVGRLDINREPEGAAARFTATVSDLVMSEYVPASAGREAGYRPGWQEPKVELAAEMAYRAAGDEWTIQHAAVRSNSLAAAVAGSVADLSGQVEADLRGTIDYDLADIGPVVAAALGLDLTLIGRNQATFELRGPLFAPETREAARLVNTDRSAADPPAAWSQRLVGHAAAGWDAIEFFGLPIGRGRVEASLRDGQLSLAPLGVPVGATGRLSVSAQARLAPPPRELVIPDGTLITDVEITPEVSDKLLKYFIPTLADALETQGKFSLATQGARMPLDDPEQVQSAGKLTVHAARVRPGRSGQQWTLLVEQIEALLKNRQVPQLLTRPQKDWLTIDEQMVDYRLANGRVYHENLVFMIGEVEVHSRGSVGFDQSLDVEIAVPVQDKWVEGRPWLAGFRGQTIRGTIRGTFDNIDRGTLVRDLSRQLLEGAAAGAIEEGLNRALDRIFRPR